MAIAYLGSTAFAPDGSPMTSSAFDTTGATLHDMQRTLGKNGQLYYLPNPADLAYSQRYSFLARQRELSALEYPHPRTRRQPMRLTERL